MSGLTTIVILFFIASDRRSLNAASEVTMTVDANPSASQSSQAGDSVQLTYASSSSPMLINGLKNESM